VIATGNAGQLVVFGSSIQHPKSFLWALAVLGAYQFYSATIIGVLAEQIWKELFRIERERHGRCGGLLFSSTAPPRPPIFDLLSPPSVMRIIVSRALPARKPQHDSWGLLIWFLYIVGPCAFFAWSVYILAKQGDNWSVAASIVVVLLCWRAVGTFWRVANSGFDHQMKVPVCGTGQFPVIRGKKLFGDDFNRADRRVVHSRNEVDLDFALRCRFNMREGFDQRLGASVPENIKSL
jgi:hypothetical protein